MYRHCPSAKRVSKASEDLPEPDTPVTTVTRSWGIASDTFFRLFCRAPSIRSQEGWAIPIVLLRWRVYGNARRSPTRCRGDPRAPALTAGRAARTVETRNDNHY